MDTGTIHHRCDERCAANRARFLPEPQWIARSYRCPPDGDAVVECHAIYLVDEDTPRVGDHLMFSGSSLAPMQWLVVESTTTSHLNPGYMAVVAVSGGVGDPEEEPDDKDVVAMLEAAGAVFSLTSPESTPCPWEPTPKGVNTCKHMSFHVNPFRPLTVH